MMCFSKNLLRGLWLAFLVAGLMVGPAVAKEEAKDAEKKQAEAEAVVEAEDKAQTEAADDAKAKDSEAAKAESGEAEPEADKKADTKAEGDEEAAKDAEEKEEADEEDGDKDDDAKKEKKPKKKRKTFTVEPKRLKVDVTVDGTFMSRQMVEVKLKPESWSSFEITDVVEHGATVKEGDVLLKFDDEKLNDSISELELSQRLSEISLMRAEEELPRLEKSLEMELENAERSEGYTKEDYKEYKDKGRDQRLLGMDLSLKQFRMALESAREELEQLEKMYDEDDLTEETEEIVLKRQRQMVELYESYAEIIEYSDQQMRGVYLPRSEAYMDDSIERSAMSLSRARLSHKLDLNAARYRLEQQRRSREKSLEKHAKLIADRGLMTVRAPASGVVYYGKNVNGKWSDLSSMLKKLKPESTVSKNQVLMTIVDPSELYLYGTIGEKHLPSVAAGQPALATPSAEGADPLRAAVAMVSDVPVSSGKYAVEVELKTDDLPAWLDPGMTGKVKVTTYDNKEALIVPKKAVHTDEFDETVKYVWVVTASDEDADDENEGEEEADEEEDEDEGEEDADDDGDDDDGDDEADEEDEPQVEKRFVKLGKSKKDDVEIVDGVLAGDVLSLEDEEKWAEEAAKDKKD